MTVLFFAGPDPDHPGQARRYEWCTKCGNLGHTVDDPAEGIAHCGCRPNLQDIGNHVTAVTDKGVDAVRQQLTDRGVPDHIIAEVVRLMYGA